MKVNITADDLEKVKDLFEQLELVQPRQLAAALHSEAAKAVCELLDVAPDLVEAVEVLTAERDEFELAAHNFRDAHQMAARDFEKALQDAAKLRAELAEVKRERDQAAAHDGQPYPTADAYRAASAAVEKHRDRADILAGHMETLRDRVYRFGRHGEPEWVKDFHTDLHRLACDAVNADKELRNALPSTADEMEQVDVAELVTYLVVPSQVVGNEKESWTVYSSPLLPFKDRAEAGRVGFEMLEHDDFCIATLRGGKLFAYGPGMKDFTPGQRDALSVIADDISVDVHPSASTSDGGERP